MKFFILGNVSLLCGLLIYYALPPLIDMYINSQIILTPNSKSYPLWKEVPVPIYQKFFFFNVTNAQDVEQRGARPILQEVGPFTYRAEMEKQDIEIDETQNTIRFKHLKNWYFEPELSIADEYLQLVTLNAPLAITLSLIQSASDAIRLIVTFSLDGLSEGFFTRRSIKQLLFDGYPDLLTTFGPLLNAEMLSQGGHFGYMNARNHTIEATYEVNAGTDDIRKLNTINKFNDRTQLPYWQNQSKENGGFCNSLEGSSLGDIFPPLTDDQNQVKLFQPDFCRVWRLNYQSRFEHSSGLRLRRFFASRDVFKNSSESPENSCFFKKSHGSSSVQSTSNRIISRISRLGRQQQHSSSGRHTRLRHEWPNGVFSLAPCKFNAPIYISMPHFLDADPYFSSKVEGLEPDREKHEFFLDLEPRTGSPVTLAARAQINVAISKPPGLVRFRNIPEIMFPVFWQEVSVNVTGPVLDQLLLASRQTQEATLRISYSFLLLGAAVLITTGLFYFNRWLRATYFSQAASKSTNSFSASVSPEITTISGSIKPGIFH